MNEGLKQLRRLTRQLPEKSIPDKGKNMYRDPEMGVCQVDSEGWYGPSKEHREWKEVR